MKIVLSALWASSIVAVAGCVDVNARRLLLSSGRLEQVGILIRFKEKKFKWYYGSLKLEKGEFFLSCENVFLEV